jgi:hypothetical protein
MTWMTSRYGRSIGRLQLDADVLQFSASFIRPDVEPGIGTAGGGDQRRARPRT